VDITRLIAEDHILFGSALAVSLVTIERLRNRIWTASVAFVPDRTGTGAAHCTGSFRDESWLS